jgi:hypothetical protein
MRLNEQQCAWEGKRCVAGSAAVCVFWRAVCRFTEIQQHCRKWCTLFSGVLLLIYRDTAAWQEVVHPPPPRCIMRLWHICKLCIYCTNCVQERSGDRIPVGARFSAPVHTGPEAHPTHYTMGTGSLSRRWSGRGVALTTHTHLTLKLKKELYLYSHFGPSWTLPGRTLLLPLPIKTTWLFRRVRYTNYCYTCFSTCDPQTSSP